MSAARKLSQAEAPGAVYRLEICGWTPTLVNELLHAHPMRAATLKRSDRDLVRGYAFVAGIPAALGKRRVSVELHGWPRGRLPDPDAVWKSLLDALVAAGLLVDDSARWCEPVPPTFVRSPRRRTVVTLESVAACEA
jgi:hypothetical protein